MKQVLQLLLLVSRKSDHQTTKDKTKWTTVNKAKWVSLSFINSGSFRFVFSCLMILRETNSNNCKTCFILFIF